MEHLLKYCKTGNSKHLWQIQDQKLISVILDKILPKIYEKYSDGKYYDLARKLDMILENNPGDWVIYTKEGCDYCKKAKELLTKNQKKFIVIPLTDENKEKYYEKIDSITNNYRKFPIILYKNKFVGGYVDLSKIFN